MLYFDTIEVVNRLKKEYVHDTIKNYTIHYDKIAIFDKIHHAINEFCSVHTLQEVYIDKFSQLDESLKTALESSNQQWAPGIEIIAIRVTKPRIPETIRLKYEAMESEKTKLLIASQRQKVVESEELTALKKAVIEAEQQAAVARINAEKDVSVKEAQKEIASIEDDVLVGREKSLADSDFYRSAKEAESNRLLYTPEVLTAELLRASTTNVQINYGDKVPMYSAAAGVNSRSSSS